MTDRDALLEEVRARLQRIWYGPDARTDIQRLLAVVDSLRAERDALRTALERAQRVLLDVNRHIQHDLIPFFGDDEHELIMEIETQLKRTAPPSDPA